MAIRIRPRSKYGAQPTVVDGIRFASKKEATRYGELKLLEKAGEIDTLRMQPGFPLCAIRWDIVTDLYEPHPIGEYRADFSYRDKRIMKTIVEDVKGFKTPLYRWKKKHVEAQYGITIREI